MQTAVTTLTAPVIRTASTLPCEATTLVVFTAVDGALADAGTRAAPDARNALRLVAARDIPLVLVSDRPAAELLALQSALGMRHPFVAGGGASLHIPAGYFPELTRIGVQADGWNIVEFKAPEGGHAIRLLISLYRLCSDGVLVVALADSERDRVLLHEADVPVIVRNGGDQDALRREIPSAYFTTAAGAAGWSEAILGSVGE